LGGPLSSRPVSRILSWTAIHLGLRLSPATGASLGPAAYLELGGQRQRSCLALHRVGFAWPPRRRDAGALLPHHFNLAGGDAHVLRPRLGGVFLWHFPAGFPGSVPRPPCPAVSGLSSRGRLSPRPPRDCLAGNTHGRPQLASRPALGRIAQCDQALTPSVTAPSHTYAPSREPVPRRIDQCAPRPRPSSTSPRRRLKCPTR
jgi:hypothetical protein